MRILLPALLCAFSLVRSATAQEVVLFGQSWRAQRFDYHQALVFPDPLSPGHDVALVECEAACFLPGDHLLLSSRQMNNAPNNSARCIVVEARLDTDSQGAVTGLSYVRTVLVNDVGSLGSAFDLDPKGLTRNLGPSGLAANGNLVVGSGHQFAHAYTLASGAYLGTSIDLDPPNDDLEDIAWMPDASGPGGSFVTLDQSGTPRAEIYGTSGAWLGGFPVGTAATPPAPGGAPKGITWLDDALAFPLAFRGQGGVVLVALDDAGPALQAFTRGGTLLAYEPLASSTFVPGTQGLRIEGLAADPVSGRVLLVQQGTGVANDFLWVLSPDCNHDGIADALDLAAGTSVDVNGDGVPDECQPLGGLFCTGDGSLLTPCPCANYGASDRGCDNSAATGGARLAALGSTQPDSVLFTADGLLPSALAIVLQGNATSGAGIAFGDGVRCVAGSLVRLYAEHASAGVVHAPGSSELHVRAQSAALGAPIASGSTRWYQVYYRDPSASFCPAPPGNSWNVSSGLAIAW